MWVLTDLGDWPKRPSLRHPRAEQGAQRRGADLRIHAVTSTRCRGVEYAPGGGARPHSGPAVLFAAVAAWDPRVSATSPFAT